jgi:hypothetical protein
MKKTPTLITVLVLLAVSAAGRTATAQATRDAAPPVERLTLNIELADLPWHAAANSFWEISYRWQIADARDFDWWLNDGGNMAKLNNVGVPINEQSFRRDDLSALSSRGFNVSVPLMGDLRDRIRNAGQRQQIVWLDAVVRIHDSGLGTDIVKRVTPVWGPYFYRDGNANLRMEVTSDGHLQWYTGVTPPWASGGKN